MVTIDRWRLLLVPTVGGILYGVVAYALWRWKPRDIVDAIEANALHGGHMSLSDSLRLTGLTVLSAGVGASVGLEAAYTQLGAGTASRIGRYLHLRRGDLRTFVGCGAAAAIARSVQRAARRRVLCVRTGHRHLYAGDAGARGAGRGVRDPGQPRAFRRAADLCRLQPCRPVRDQLSDSRRGRLCHRVAGHRGDGRSYLCRATGPSAPRCRPGHGRLWVAWCSAISPWFFPADPRERAWRDREHDLGTAAPTVSNCRCCSG